MENSECLSGRLSDCMDLSGYNIKMILYRQQMNAYLDQIYNREATPVTKVTVLTTGAKGEGTAKYFESDIDRLYTHTQMVCIDTKDVETKIKNMYEGQQKTIFRGNQEGCFPGYTRLELFRMGTGHSGDDMEISTVKVGCKVFFKNDWFPNLPRRAGMYDINGLPIDEDKRSGPSRSVSNQDISYDFVHGIIYDNRRFLVRWSKRPRKHDWPPSDLMEKVLYTKGHVVPVASKNTDYMDTEWRICYTEAELLLTRSLNEYQIKVLILLKMVSKSLFQPITKEISSYVNKNVIFWMAEMNSTSSFTRENLFQIFRDSLCFLRDCLLEGRLVSYIIEEKNLLEGRISKCQGRQLAEVIENLLSTKTNLLKSLKIWPAFETLQNAPIEMKESSEKRDQVEMLLLHRNVVFKRIECESYYIEDLDAFPKMLKADAEWKQIGERLHSLVVPDFERLCDSEIDTFDIYKRALLDMLS